MDIDAPPAHMEDEGVLGGALFLHCCIVRPDTPARSCCHVTPYFTHSYAHHEVSFTHTRRTRGDKYLQLMCGKFGIQHSHHPLSERTSVSIGAAGAMHVLTRPTSVTTSRTGLKPDSPRFRTDRKPFLHLLFVRRAKHNAHPESEGKDNL